ncbi:MAG: ATPase domain-containing protein [Kiritimatiellia bacterium]
MIDKTLTGVSFFDERYGGTYRHRPMILCGRAGTGKTVFALQFIMQGILQDERCLILSAWRANDLVIFAESIGFPISRAIDSGRLVVLEYNQYVPGRDKEWNIVLPSEGFLQLEELIHSQAVQRVVLDTCLPWVCILEHQRLDEHLFSFIRAFDRMQVTTVLTMPKPVSPLAFRVKNTLENLAPVSITLAREPNNPVPQWIVSKYLGEKRIAGGTPYRIIKGSGLVAAVTVASALQTAVPPAALSPPPTPEAQPGRPTSAVQAAAIRASAPPPNTEDEKKEDPSKPGSGKNIKFSSLIPGLDRITPIPERRKLNRPF